MEADADGLLAPTDLPVLGEVAYAAGHLDVTIEAWERAHAACLQAGDQVAAAGAAVRVAMHLLFDTALMAPVRGWLARAERLLEGRSETPAHAWLAVVRTYERMLTGDLPGARRWAPRAIEVGSKCDPAACAITPNEARRALKRRLADVIYRQLLKDRHRPVPPSHLTHRGAMRSRATSGECTRAPQRPNDRSTFRTRSQSHEGSEPPLRGSPTSSLSHDMTGLSAPTGTDTAAACALNDHEPASTGTSVARKCAAYFFFVVFRPVGRLA